MVGALGHGHNSIIRALAQILCFLLVVVPAACTRISPSAGTQQRTIRIVGADSAVNLAQAWAEAFNRSAADIKIEVSGGGSHVGIQALFNGTADIATMSRELTPQENENLAGKFGAAPTVSKVALEWFIVIVHKDNPVASLSLTQLKEIFQEGGKIDDWSQLGVAGLGAITRIEKGPSLPDSFQLLVFDRRPDGRVIGDIKAGAKGVTGTHEKVKACGEMPAGICYAGYGCQNKSVRIVPLSKASDDAAVLPSAESAKDGNYPLATSFLFITAPKSSEAAQRFVAFVQGPDGQRVTTENGYFSP